jgi:hypothetical protein
MQGDFACIILKIFYKHRSLRMDLIRSLNAVAPARVVGWRGPRLSYPFCERPEASRENLCIDKEVTDLAGAKAAQNRPLAPGKA